MPDQHVAQPARIYAQGCLVMVDGKETPDGYTMGGPLAECDTEAQAAEIARRCDAYPRTLDLLRILTDVTTRGDAFVAALAAARTLLATLEGSTDG